MFRALTTVALAALTQLACTALGGSDASGADNSAWVGKWRGPGAYVITATGSKPITGSATVELAIQKGAKPTSIRIVGADGKGWDLFLDPAHPGTASMGDGIHQSTTVTDAN